MVRRELGPRRVTSLFQRKVEDGIRLIPLLLEEESGDSLSRRLPTRLRKLARRSVRDFDSILDALVGVDRRPGVVDALRAPALAARLTLAEVRPEGKRHLVRTTLKIDGQVWTADAPWPAAALALDGATSGLLLGELGRRVGALLFAGAVGRAVEDVVGGLGAGAVLDLSVCAPDSLAAVPFEAALLPSGRAPALVPGVRLWRLLGGTAGAVPTPAAAPGPLKILVAVGAPDEGQTPNQPLDIEAEMGSILDAAAEAVRDGRAEVRVLEVANAETVGAALAEDDYHVLHLFGHGSGTTIELANEDGGAVPTTASDLAAAIRGGGRVVPLVWVSACRGGETPTGLAFELHRQRVARVVAMQAPVTERYATRLAAAFYRELSRPASPRAGVALAAARQTVEALRQRDPLLVDRPEWATATLLLRGEDTALLDSDLPQVNLRRPPVHTLGGVVPALGLGELVGRRGELRTTLRALRGDERFESDHGDVAGVVLTGAGGVGKSSVAGRAMVRLADSGWVCSATRGPVSPAAIWRELVADLAASPQPWAAALARQLTTAPAEDEVRIGLVQRVLRQHPVVLVLDDFEANLTTGGEAFIDEGSAQVVEALLSACATGKLLLTCRNPLPSFGGALWEVPVGPLSPAETCRLFQRLEGLRRLGRHDVALVCRLVGGHPRVLELLDALLRRGAAVEQVRPKLEALAREEDVDVTIERDLAAGIADAVQLATRDILLEELLRALDPPEREVLLQIAVCGLPVEPADVAETMAGIGIDEEIVAQASARLVSLSLVVKIGKGLWVHRWTAEALRGCQPPEEYRTRCRRAGELRRRRIQRASRSVDEWIEATECFLAARALDDAAAIALRVAEFLASTSTLALLSFVARVRSELPTSHSAYKFVADHEGQALHAMGFTDAAIERYSELVREHERLAEAEPNRSDYQSDLSTSCQRLADLMVAVGKGEEAARLYSQTIDISRRLADAEPDQVAYQRGVAVPCQRLGDLMVAAGKGEEAARLYSQSLDIARRLAEAEPERADHQRDLSAAYGKLGDLMVAVGKGEEAARLYSQSLDIARRLADAEPERVDYQQHLSASYSALGHLMVAVGKGEEAARLYYQSLEISRRLAEAEPDRVDYQSDLSKSYHRMADLMRTVGKGEEAARLYNQSLNISRRLAEAEPDRADYRRDQSVPYLRLGDLMMAEGKGEEAARLYNQSLDIGRRLVEAEPERVDYQRVLSASYQRLGDLMMAEGKGEEAVWFYNHSLDVAGRLAEAEPHRADYQRDQSVSYSKLGDLMMAEGKREEAVRFYTQSLDIFRRLAEAEPHRADYQSDLAFALQRLNQDGRDVSRDRP